jgi:hypothetical protein
MFAQGSKIQRKMLTTRIFAPCNVTVCVAINLFVLSSMAVVAHAERGVVTMRPSACDYFLIYTPSEFVLAEWYGGRDPSRGERVVGAFNGYGFKTVFYGNLRMEGRIYIEDYWLDEDDALEKLSEQCN